MANPTYRELNRNEMGWIASHVATDLLNMNNPNDVVTDRDMAKIIDARSRDATVRTLPRERSLV